MKTILKKQLDALIVELKNTPEGVQAQKLRAQIEALANTLGIKVDLGTKGGKAAGSCSAPPTPGTGNAAGLFSLPNLLLAGGAGLFLTGTRGVLPMALLAGGAFLKFKEMKK